MQKSTRFSRNKNMIIEIDQSGKIENTSKLTVVAYANGKSRSILISAVEKRKLVKIMRVHDYPRQIFVLKIFAGMIFLLLKNEQCHEVVIDKEYTGHDGIIKDILRSLFVKTESEMPDIKFMRIGKKSDAHKTALAVYRGKRKPDIIVRADNILRIFYR